MGSPLVTPQFEINITTKQYYISLCLTQRCSQLPSRDYYCRENNCILIRCLSVCLSTVGILFLNHAQPCLWLQVVTKGCHSRLFFEFFENSRFWPFFGGFWVKIDPKIDIFTKSGRIFFWQGPGRILDSKWVYQEHFQGHAEFGAEIRIFIGRYWTQKPPNLSIFSEICTFHKVIEHMFLV